MSLMEFWDVYNLERIHQGYAIDRAVGVKKDEYHLIAHVCVFNQKNEMLLQKRQSNKINWPNIWDFSAGGAAISGENTQKTAEREAKEELSLNISLQNQRPYITVYCEEGFDDYFIVEVNPEQEKNIVGSNDEVAEIRWFSLPEILKLCQEGLTDIYYSFFCMLFEMKKGRGNHKLSR